MKKNQKTYLILIISILAIIFGILYIKGLNQESLDEKTARCISEKAIMYSQTSCSHCLYQKKLLGDFVNLFKMIECDKETQKCIEAGITGTPTWLINNKKFEGTKTIKELRKLTGC